MKRGFLFCLAGPLALAQPILRPSAPPVVKQGDTLKFQADRVVTWSLDAGAPATAYIEQDGAFHAPLAVRPRNVAAGCQIGPNSNIFNTRIDNLPVHAKSSVWMNYYNGVLSTVPVDYLPDMPFNSVLSTDPATSMSFFYTPTNNGLYIWPDIPWWKRESGYYVYDTADMDSHAFSVTSDTCHVYEQYQTRPVGWYRSCPTCNSVGGLSYDAQSFAMGTENGSTDAAGLPITPLVLHYGEFQAGAINHALRMTMTLMNSGVRTWPASPPGGDVLSSPAMPYGARLRLKSSFAIQSYTALCDAACQVQVPVLIAQLKQYGIINADNSGGGQFHISAEQAQWPKAMLDAMGEVGRQVYGRDLEVVDESALRVADNSSEVAWNNGYVTPAGARVCATGTDGKTTCLPVILQGVAVGLRWPNVTIQAGAGPFPLEAWVTGATDSTITWSMSPAVGTLDSATGLYTPPDAIPPNTKQTATITATSNADPTVSATMGLTVLPGGTVFVNEGDTTDYTDSQGNTWFGHLRTGDPVIGVFNYVGSHENRIASWQNTPEPGLYAFSSSSYNDQIHRVIVPNGNYIVTLYFGADQGAPAESQWMWLESQGQIVKRNYDIAAAAGGIGIATSVAMPATVTDGNLFFSLRWHGVPPPTVYPDNTGLLYKRGWPPNVAAYTIAPDPSDPYITIDYPNPAPATPGQTVQLYAVGWYMSNSVTWSISPQVGSIDGNGVYTAPSNPPSGGDQTITVTATSTVDATKIATATITFTFGAISVTPANTTLVRSLTQKFAANINGMAYSNRVTWSVSTAGGLNAALGAIDASGLYTAADTVANDTVVTVTATSIDDPRRSGSVKITVLARQPDIRVDPGDSVNSFTDLAGNQWASDPCLGSPAPSYCEGTSAYGRYDITVPNVPAVLNNAGGIRMYQSSRYRYDGTLSYRFAVPNGPYEVTLHFCDWGGTGTGRFLFDVVLNGSTVLSNWDEGVAAGVDHGAVVQHFSTTVANRMLDISFVVRRGGAIINGIEIVPAGPQRAVP